VLHSHSVGQSGNLSTVKKTLVVVSLGLLVGHGVETVKTTLSRSGKFFDIRHLVSADSAHAHRELPTLMGEQTATYAGREALVEGSLDLRCVSHHDALTASPIFKISFLRYSGFTNGAQCAAAPVDPEDYLKQIGLPADVARALVQRVLEGKSASLHNFMMPERFLSSRGLA
jgi:hypothetical protein